MNDREIKKECEGNLRGTPQHQHNLNNKIVPMKDTKSNKENKPTVNDVYNKAQPLESKEQNKYAELKELDIDLHPELRITSYNGKHRVENTLIYPTYAIKKDADCNEIKVSQQSGQMIFENGFKQAFSEISGSFYLIGCKADEIGSYEKIRCCEGLATGEKVHLGGGKKAPVLCYLSKSYFRKFLESFKGAYPDIKIEIACDIDAVEDIERVIKELGCTDIWIAKPTLTEEEEVKFREYEKRENKHADFWDLFKVGGKDRVREELEKIYEVEQDAETIARTKAKHFYDNAIFVKSQKDHKFLSDKHIAYLKDLKIAEYEDEKMLLIPMFNSNFEFRALQMLTENGDKQYYPETSEKGNFAMIGFNKKEDLKNVDTIVIAVDYETADSIYQATNTPLLVTSSTDNLLNDSIISILKKYTKPQLKLVVDNTFGEKEKKIIENYACLRKYGCGVVYPIFNNIEKQEYRAKYDADAVSFNNLFIFKGKDAVRGHYYHSTNTVQSEVEKELRAGKKPYPYIVNDEGLFLITIKELTSKEKAKKKKNKFEEVFDDRDEKIILEWISGKIEVVAQTRSEIGGDWGTAVKFKDQDGKERSVTLPKSKMTNACEDIYSFLQIEGLQVTTDQRKKRHLIEYIFNSPNPNRAWSTDRVGWFKDFFILPECITPETNEVILQKDYTSFNYSKKGTLEEWQQNIAIHCEGNSRLILALAIAFAAPLLPILGSESYGINLIGSSSTGKSTALKVASSVYGGHNYIQQWRATDNALESVAEGHNHTLLCLDEMGQADGKKVGETAYMLANGQGKNRLDKNSVIKKKYEWETLFLSTGEVSISDKVQEYGKNVKAGMEVRCIDVPADAGQGYKLFDTLHSFNSGEDFSNHLQEATNQYYGVSLIEFLTRFQQIEGGKEELKKMKSKIKKDFFEEHINKNRVDGQVKRVANHFADLIASGRLAVSLGIIPFEKEGIIDESIIQCFNDWLNYRGSSKSGEEKGIIEQTKGFFEAHHKSRFVLLDEENQEKQEDEKVIKTVGYKKKREDGYYEFYLTASGFKEVCEGFQKMTVTKILIENRLLLEGGERSDGTKVIKIDKKSHRLYCFTPQVLVFKEEV